MEELDVERLIEEVRIRPLLWDWSLEEYKETSLKKYETWMEVCNEICEAFEEKSESDKKVIVQDAKMRWRTVRDNFFKSCRKQLMTTPLGKKHRKYLYWNQLQFLVPNFESRMMNQTTLRPSRKRVQPNVSCTEESDLNPNEDNKGVNNTKTKIDNYKMEPNSQYQNEEFQIYDGEDILEVPLLNRGGSLAQPKKKKHSVEEALVTFMDAHGQQKRTDLEPVKILSEDEQFFNSLLSSVSELSDMQKLQFRIDVMQALVRVKQSSTNICANQESVSTGGKHSVT